MNIDDQKQSMADKLADLGSTFNTNKNFGLMGMLENQQAPDSGSAPPAPTTPAAGNEEHAPEWFGLLNTTVQGIKQDLNQNIGQLRQEIASVRTAPAQEHQQAEHLDPASAEVNSVRQDLVKVRLNAAWDRAKSALSVAKAKDKDFDYTEKELQDVWVNRIGNNVAAAESTNWDIYFDQQIASRKAPRLEQENSRLKQELDALKNAGITGAQRMNDMSASPRTGRTSAPPPNGSDFDEEVYRRASARMGKGKFKGFNRALVEEQNRRLLTA